jgi:hypothetical protein
MLADRGWLHIARLLTRAARYPIPSHDREGVVLLRSNSARRIGKKHWFAQHIAISGPYRVEYAGSRGLGWTNTSLFAYMSASSSRDSTCPRKRHARSCGVRAPLAGFRRPRSRAASGHRLAGSSDRLASRDSSPEPIVPHIRGCFLLAYRQDARLAACALPPFAMRERTARYRRPSEAPRRRAPPYGRSKHAAARPRYGR